MKVEWNKVTWYSKTLAMLLLVALPFVGFYFGISYQKNIDSGQVSLNKSYSNPCKAGEVALFEGGLFSGCRKPSASNQTNQPNSTNNSSNQSPATNSANINQKTYDNPCKDAQVALYEGGIFAGCAKTTQ